MTIISKTFAAAALATAVLAAPLAAQAATTNYALIGSGASFVNGSSIIPDGTFGLTINHAVMQDNLLTDTPGAAISNGDPRYIFGSFDADGTVEIDLGQLRLVSSLGANVQVPSFGDRYIVGPFHASVSTDGLSYTAFGSPVSSVAIDASTVNPVTLTGPLQGVRFVRYSFGPDSLVFPGGGGSAIYQLFATGPSAAPEPSTWAMLLVGFGGAGALLRRRGGSVYRLVEALPTGEEIAEEFAAPDDETAIRRAAMVAEGQIQLWRGDVRIAPVMNA
jgi:hypothetical protein